MVVSGFCGFCSVDSSSSCIFGDLSTSFSSLHTEDQKVTMTSKQDKEIKSLPPYIWKLNNVPEAVYIQYMIGIEGVCVIRLIG
ncbi:hypothetical protein ACET3Z_010886 [Daucus carota]